MFWRLADSARKIHLRIDSKMGKMPSLNKLPVKCQECGKSQAPCFQRRCHFCRDLEFQESVLCDLNRCIQDMANFQCHAFEPMLEVVNLSKNSVTDALERPSKGLQKEPYLKLFRSDKIKYERALALQKLGRDPEGVYVQVKYHLAWNVKHRMPLFNPVNDFISFAHDTFLLCSEKVNGLVNLLHLAQDHVHLYIESDGELSVEEMGYGIKRFSNKAILEKHPFLREKFVKDAEIWDEAYFVETVG
jgi:putative transposase